MLAAAQDADMPLCLHFGTRRRPRRSRPTRTFAVAIALFGTNAQFATVDLLLSPVFHKFPRLRVALSEGGIGWIPYVLERTDYTWERHRWYTGVNTDVRPSDLFRDHIFGCFIADNAGLDDAGPHRHRQHHVRGRLPAQRQQLPGDPARSWPTSSPTFPTTRPA